jgi:Flp pilus assembly protein TadB
MVNAQFNVLLFFSKLICRISLLVARELNAWAWQYQRERRSGKLSLHLPRFFDNS